MIEYSRQFKTTMTLREPESSERMMEVTIDFLNEEDPFEISSKFTNDSKWNINQNTLEAIRRFLADVNKTYKKGVMIASK